MTEHDGVRTESATDELRRMLDERGVPWKGYGHENHTWWGAWHAENRASVNGLFLKVEGVVTPEQAIAATLGWGECKADKLCDGYLYYTSYWCRGCDERFAYRPIGNEDRCASPKFCPNCGAKVVDDG